MKFSKKRSKERNKFCGYLLDTNIISYLIDNNIALQERLQAEIFKGNKVFINGIVYYEIKRGLLAVNSNKKQNAFGKICNTLEILLLGDIKIFDEASEIFVSLKKKGRTIPEQDIFIAATAKNYNLVLVSNDGHFKYIDGLMLENWLE